MRLLSASVAVACVLPNAAAAAQVWVGDFETGDLSQWGYTLNPEINGVPYAFATDDPVIQGAWAGHIELHDDAVWGNGLRRVELQHAPDAARTAEGATTYFAWSFYLPETLSEDPDQQIGYWESQNSYQQMMAFAISGETISFSTRRPENVVQWEQSGAATAGQWHRIAMAIAWSKQVDTGRVSVWFDGEQVVTDAPAQTLADDNPHFTQVGLLRGDFDFADVPIIVIDDAVEGDSLADVHPELEEPGGTTGGSDGGSGDSTGSVDDGGSSGNADGSSTGSASASATNGSDDGSATTGTTAATDGGGSSESGAPADDGDGGCGCTSQSRDRGTLAIASLGVLAWARRRQRRVDA